MKKNLTEFFNFPNPVNEVSARFVASGVFLISIFSLIFMFLNKFQIFQTHIL